MGLGFKVVAAGAGAFACHTAWRVADTVAWHRRNAVPAVEVASGSAGGAEGPPPPPLVQPCSRLVNYRVVVDYFFAPALAPPAAAPAAAKGVAATLKDLVSSISGGAASGGTLSRGAQPTPEELAGECSFRYVPGEGAGEGGGAGGERPAVRWPHGQDLFATMALVPDGGRDPIQRALDASTHQTIVKCKGGLAQRQTWPPVCVADTSTILAPYLRAMVGAFAFLPLPLPGPLRVCQLGVGGGALPMFVEAHFGAAVGEMQLVDVEPAVFDAAIRGMGLRPPGAASGALMTHVVADAAAFVGAAPPKSIDVLLVDLFVGSSMPWYVGDASFLAACKAATADRGVVAFNLPGPNPAFAAECARVFGSPPVGLPVAGNGNTVYVAGAALNQLASVRLTRRQIARRFSRLSEHYALPFDVAATLPLHWWVW